jgi:DNA invertase Pin-like site-specific DNA recombinase
MQRKLTTDKIVAIKNMLQYNWNISEIARNLGLSRMSVYRAINKYSLRKQNIFTKLKHLIFK